MNINNTNRFKALDSMPKKSSLYAFQSRGREFETLINDVFQDEGVLLRRSYHTADNSSEQIDGAIEVNGRVFLLEVKWVESGLAASELFSFIGKVENKFHGTLGIFLSRAELAENFINALNKGRRQSVIVIHGKDVDDIFNNQLKISDYITHTFKLLSYDHVLHYPVTNYINSQAGNQVLPGKIASPTTNPIISLIVSGTTTTSDLNQAIISANDAELDDAFSYVVKRYGRAYKYAFDNVNFSFLTNFNIVLNNHIPSQRELNSLAEVYYTELTKQSLQAYSSPKFVNLFSSHYDQISEEAKELFKTNILEAWQEGLGNYDRENELTRLIRPLWEKLSKSFKEKLEYYYLSIFVSDRLDKFEQKSFANTLVYDNLIERPAVEAWLDKSIKDSKNWFSDWSENTNEKVGVISRSYVKIASYLNIDKTAWTDFVREKLDLTYGK
ncbi:hypothetical protein [Hymenobacter armeniacus]|uniref:Restriction endonuclease type IV Mrr domain-containing protein n=1 Tax=Hymenobacter armeniacus TaxID=2771358 RepID=A0ABR8JPX1_9BACT|nr:hypothetical protein [Hymenobacter armeniacus]MBD2720813.1 hypothetical protein [Hymenobacter armeniacus]